MAAVGNSIEIPYAARVFASVDVPLWPRVRQSIAIDFRILGSVNTSFEAVYDITDYNRVGNSVKLPIAARAATSITIPYKAYFAVGNSVKVQYSALSQVGQSVQVEAHIPGYTRVGRSVRVLTRWLDQKLLTPTTGITLTKL